MKIEFFNPRKLPPIPAQVITGVLRKGAVMVVSGPSKAGKTFLLLELACSIVTGGKWLGFSCVAGRVLYLNLEVERGEFMHRLDSVIRASDYSESQKHALTEHIGMVHLRGMVAGMKSLVDQTVKTVAPGDFDLIIIDPSYKVMQGDENAARDVHLFTNELDRLASETGAAVIYCHHHSKGAKGDVKALDRFSGSGVFARHADAIFDLIELAVDDDVKAAHGLEGCPCFRVDITTRSFAKPDDFDVIFRYPRHYRDYDGTLADCRPDSPSTRGGNAMKLKGLETRAQIERTAAELLADSDDLSLQTLAACAGVSPRTVKRHLEESDAYQISRRGRGVFIEAR